MSKSTFKTLSSWISGQGHSFSPMYFFFKFHFEGLWQNLMSRTSSIEQYSKDECRREIITLAEFRVVAYIVCMHQRSLEPMMYLVWSSGERTIRYSLIGSQEHPWCSERSSLHLKKSSQCSSEMSQLFMHGIQGLIRGEVGGEIIGGGGGTGGLPSRLREEKAGMSGLPTEHQ